MLGSSHMAVLLKGEELNDYAIRCHKECLPITAFQVFLL